MVNNDFQLIWPEIDNTPGFLLPGQEKWLYQTVLTLPNDAVIVEIGSFLGRSTTAMAYACRETKRTIYAIDTYAGNSDDFVSGLNGVEWEGGSFLDVFKDNLSKNSLLRYVQPTQGLSSNIGRYWDRPIDFLFVDGSHVFEDVIRDLNLFFPYVKPGGIVALHDVTPSWDGPYRAWRNHLCNRLEATGSLATLAFGAKPEESKNKEISFNALTSNMEPEALKNEGTPLKNHKNMIIIIIGEKDAGAVIDTVNSIKSQPCKGRATLILLDRSGDYMLADTVRRAVPYINVMEKPVNSPWTDSVDLILKDVSADHAPDSHVILLNAGSIASDNLFKMLTTVVEQSPGAMACPMFQAGESAAPLRGGMFEWSGDEADDRLFSVRDPKEQPTDGIRVANIFGAFIPLSLIQKLGGFGASKTRLLLGDLDFLARASKAGVDIIESMTAVVMRPKSELIPGAMALINLNKLGYFEKKMGHFRAQTFYKELSTFITANVDGLKRDIALRKIHTRLPCIKIVIPVHNRVDETLECMATIDQQDYAGEVTVTVVDDGSTDGTEEKVLSAFPDTKIVSGDGNLWWTGAVSKGIESLMPSMRYKDYIMLINNDSRLEKTTIRTLVGISRREGQACVGTKAIDQDGKPLATGGVFEWSDIMARGYSGQDGFPVLKGDMVELDALFGRATLIPLVALKKAHGFDHEAFPHYWGDTDFFLRAKNCGIPIIATTRSTITCINHKDSTGIHAGNKMCGIVGVYRVLTSIKSNYALKYLLRFLSRHAEKKKRAKFTRKLVTRNIFLALKRHWFARLLRL